MFRLPLELAEIKKKKKKKHIKVSTVTTNIEHADSGPHPGACILLSHQSLKQCRRLEDE